VELLRMTLDGIVTGLALGLVAAGFTIIYRATRVVNFAQGQMLAIGAYLAYVLYVDMSMSIWLAIPLVFVGGLVAGLIIDQVVIGPLRRQTVLVQVIALLALARVIEGLLRIEFSAQPRNFPAFVSRRPLSDVVPSAMDLMVGGGAILILGGLSFFLYRTMTGWAMRANAQNVLGASIVGINPRRVAAIAWGLGGGITALAGVLLAPDQQLTPYMGTNLMLLAFAAVVVGGFGSMPGAIIGGVVIGISNNLVALYLSAGYEPFVVLALLLLVLTVKPSGIMGARSAA
jgi:branched-chain amino acid transport system permease protein